MRPTASSPAPPDQPRGLVAGGCAFLIWGLSAIYWKQLAHVPPWEILAHRIIWAMLLTGLLLAARGRLAETRQALARGRTLPLLLASAALVSVNWFLFIWAVTSGFVLEASLGYYITPQVNVLLGCLVLGDRPRRLQWAAIGLAGLGVLNLLVMYGRFPWVAVGLAVSFGLYGLVRKVTEIGPVQGLFVETSVAALPAGAYLALLWWTGQNSFPAPGTGTDLLLMGSGALTTAPLVCFAFAARRISLVSLGLLQYIAPTCFLLLGTLVYREPFTPAHAVTFALIWAGLALFSVEGLAVQRARRRTHNN